MDFVYMDSAASTQIDNEIIKIINESSQYYANPSGLHDLSVKSRNAIENSRNIIANSLNAKPTEIIFTSGGTESNALALIGFAEANNYFGSHIITSKSEHLSVLENCKYLENIGYRVTYLDVDNEGRIYLKQLENSIRNDTILVSLIHGNNEIATINPIYEIGQICKRYNLCFHTDAIQSYGKIKIDVNKLNIDMLSISSQKIHGAKGVGALYVRNNIDLEPIMRGGSQEFNLRAGTENVQSIIGMGKAVELIDYDNSNYKELKNKLINGIISTISYVKINGSKENSLDNIVSVSFKGIDSIHLVKMLSDKGIYVSSGSIYSGNLKPSHVLRAIRLDKDFIWGTVRFSFGRYNTIQEIDYVLGILPELVNQLRSE